MRKPVHTGRTTSAPRHGADRGREWRPAAGAPQTAGGSAARSRHCYCSGARSRDAALPRSREAANRTGFFSRDLWREKINSFCLPLISPSFCLSLIPSVILSLSFRHPSIILSLSSIILSLIPPSFSLSLLHHSVSHSSIIHHSLLLIIYDQFMLILSYLITNTLSP